MLQQHYLLADDCGCVLSALLCTQPLRPFSRLTKSAMEALRYRAEDVGRTITKAAVREARARELQRELLNSEKLSEYFQEHEAERVRSCLAGLAEP